MPAMVLQHRERLFCIFIMSTHILDKQVDKMLRDESMTDGMAHLVCQ